MSIAPTHDHGEFGPYTIENLHTREDMVLDDGAHSYRAHAVAAAGTDLETSIHADRPIEVRFDPGIMTEF
ncbi:hypothetical protein GCM10023085_01850 [Actinomadura viridis]|uniref:Uncharacterized protein n=1 Tax=Actinomadura viridis TaxID=58110 RepID=A0A931DPM6_9ACTN|nr:hypothetical protein [Actinomadura viridis]MBG6091005.1 hypothetical protein [Actinomadura viridis]